MNRTEQLGLPKARKLIATKEEFHHILEERKLQNLDKHLENSLKTIYSKSIAQKPKQEKRRSLCQRLKRKKKVGSASNDDHEKWLMNIAKPKKIFLPEAMERSKGKVDSNRLVQLSRPRNRPYPDTDNTISKATLEYVASERVLSLAQPKKEKEDDIVYGIPRISFPINPAYASIKSHGIEKLSLALHPKTKYRKGTVDDRCSYSPVSRGALQYEASAKIQKLGTPKSIEDDELLDPFKVKKKALAKLPKKQEAIFMKMSTPIEWKVTPKYVHKQRRNS